jgi:uncharacterized protein
LTLKTGKVYHVRLATEQAVSLSNPISANVHEFAKQMLEIHGRIRASHFSAVSDVLFMGKDDASEVQYTVKSEKGRYNRLGLVLAVSGERKLVCQRCLGEMSFPLDHTARFEIVTGETDLPADDDDEIDYLTADSGMDVEQLIGQELLLGLPLAPKHNNEHCSSANEIDREPKPNPFKVLQGLKDKIK